MRTSRVTVVNPDWDRCARRGIIQIGDKRIRIVNHAPVISSPREMRLFIQRIAGADLGHVRSCVFRLQDVGDTLRPSLLKSKMGTIDSQEGLSVKNVYLNHFFDETAIIIDPSPDSMKYEGHMREFSMSTDLPSELTRFAARMESYRTKKRKGMRDDEGESYESKIKREYSDFWDWLMQPGNIVKLRKIVEDTIAAQFKLGADIGMPPVPVIDSARMLDFTRFVNMYALDYWPAEQKDTASTYLILAPEVFSDDDLMKRVIAYIKSVETKFLVIKFKNLELDRRDKVDETLRMKDLLETISKIKHEHKDDKVFVALEAGVQNYLFAVGGFDIVSTSMTGFDGDFPFRRFNKNALNGYLDITTMLLRDDKYVRMILANAGFLHDGCVCSTVADYNAARVDWYDIRREHFERRMDELYTQVEEFVGQRKIELGKDRLSKSRLSNLKQALPYLEFA